MSNFSAAVLELLCGHLEEGRKPQTRVRLVPPLGPYTAIYDGVQLIRDFNRGMLNKSKLYIHKLVG